MYRESFLAVRLEFPDAVYHLTSRGNARQKIFLTDADRETFLSALSGGVRRLQVAVSH